MDYYYMLALVLSFAGMTLIDYRYKLAFFAAKRFTLLCLVGFLVFFLMWDATGIIADVFYTNQQWVSGVHVLSENMPIEEIIFLLFFGYVTLVSWGAVCSRTSS